MTGPFGEGRKPTKESYVQFSDRDARDRTLKVINERTLLANSTSGKKLDIGRMKTSWQRRRDFVMGKAEELVKQKLEKHGKEGTVKFTKSKEVRKILFNNVDAFVQSRTDATGSFVGEFADLQIP